MTQKVSDTRFGSFDELLAEPASGNGAVPGRTGGDGAPEFSDSAADKGSNTRPDPVELAGLESFPASDPPGWLGIRTGPPARRVSANQAQEGQ
jgi:hypothetical protein